MQQLSTFKFKILCVNENSLIKHLEHALKILLSITKRFEKEILNFLKTSYKKYIHYDIYHMNYNNDRLRKTWCIILICEGVPSDI